MISARSHAALAALALLATPALRAQATTPTATAPIAPATLAPGGPPTTVDLRNHFGLPGVTGTLVQFNTVMGRFNVELRADAAPRHVANFLSYVQSGAYSDSFFHRAAALEAGGISIVQGGGYRSTGGSTVSAIPKLAPVPLEYNLPNARGTLAAARTSDINSATSEWYFNVRDNTTNLGPLNGGGYTVFGRVLGNGLAVLERIAALPLTNAGAPFNELPVRDFTGGTVSPSNLVIVTSVAVIPLYPSGAGAAALAFSASSANPALVEAAIADSVLTLTPRTAGTTNVTVTATDTNGASASRTFIVTVTAEAGPTAPAFVTQPPAQIRLAAGARHTLALAVTATGTPAPTYQWRRNGVDLDDQRRATCVLVNADASAAGAYTCVVRNANGTVESRATTVSFASVEPVEAGRLVNLSILSTLAPAETMIMGTVLGGAGTRGSKSVLARVAGPALAQLGVADVLPDPQMGIRSSETGRTLAVNDDWGGTETLVSVFRGVGAFPFAAVDSKDAALFQPTLGDGGYTVEFGDTQGRPGIAIAELYDATPRPAFSTVTPRLINVSVRKQIPGDTPLTAGFVIDGETARTVLVRGIGPGLAAFGVPETLSDPQLMLFGADATKLAENDQWGGAPALAAASEAVGAFAIAGGTSNDAMLLLTLPPGSYTVRLDGKGAGGAALVEVYEVP